MNFIWGMEMTINEFIQKNLKENYHPRLPWIECMDGFCMSVQVGPGVYSEPSGIEKEYTHVEVGFPSVDESLLMQWIQDPTHPTQTVYPYVPVEIVDNVINKHGGIKND